MAKRIKGLLGGKKSGKRGYEKRELEWMDFDEEEAADEEYDEEYEDEIEEDEYYDDDETDEEDYEEYSEYDDEIDEDDEYEEYADELEDEEYEDEYEDEYDEDEIDEYEDEYDEDEIDEYDDEYEEDYEEDEGFLYRLRHLSLVDCIVGFTGVVVLALAIVTATLYLGAKGKQQQIETFVEIGVGMEEITVIGESGMLAIADAQAARQLAIQWEDELLEEEEWLSQEENGKIKVVMNLTSIQKDLKIKFVNQNSGKLVSDVGFEVEITKPSGEVYSKQDDDRDGIIYQKGIEPGRYQVRMTAPAEHEKYEISTETTAITVRDAIEYKKVDVADEVKTEAQVNAAVEDTKVNEVVVESSNKDTVEWVESTKTLIEGTEKTEETYEKVDSSKIADPSKSAMSFRLLVEGEGDPAGETTPEPPQAPDPTSEPTEEPSGEATPDPTAEPAGEATPDPTEEPSGEATPEPTNAPAATQEPTAVPMQTPTSEPTAIPTATPTAIATPSASASPAVSATVSPSAGATPTATPNKAQTDTSTDLKTTGGEKLYYKDASGNFKEAKYADYYNANIKEYYVKVKKTTGGQYRYTGWQTIDGVTYFFDKNGNKVTGEQVIQGAKYKFNEDGSLSSGSGNMGIDVSKWNGNIDWNAVKNSGVSYVIIRCGYRGSTTGALIEDPMFRSNIKGASNAGLKVGIYFFTQAMDEVEAVEEASMVLGLIGGYNISYPVFLDVEASHGRADAIDAGTRTAVCRAFCQTIQNSGYKAGIYANKTWLNSYLDAPSLSGYKIWLAQYAAAPTYNRTRYDMWQYSSKGQISGISGYVDMDISYLGY